MYVTVSEKEKVVIFSLVTEWALTLDSEGPGGWNHTLETKEPEENRVK